MKVAPLSVLLATVLLAGCWTLPEEPLDPSSTDPVSLARAGAVAHTAAGLTPLPPDAADLLLELLPLGKGGQEPTIGITGDGSIFVTGGNARVWKSSDKGKNWKDTSGRQGPTVDLDPYLWVDPVTDRVYSAPLSPMAGKCADLKWSDDGGATWQPQPLGACPFPGGHDHQSLVTGPPPAGINPRDYPNLVYYAYNSERAVPGQDGTWLTVSLDGGRTWDTGAQVFPPDCQGGLNGAPATAPDGTLYIPKPGCEGIRIGVSRDAGKNWEIHDMEQVGVGGGKDSILPAPTPVTTPFSPNPGAGADAAGNAYVAWTGADGLVHLTRSLDGGRTWTPPVRATPPGVNATAFTALVAGAEGRIAIAYLATPAPTGGWPGPEAHHAPPDTRWHLHVTFATNALAEDPVFVTVRATPDDDPVQIGCIWQSGGEHPCRNLRDFIDATEHDGRVYVAYTDGCKRCRTAEESRRVDLHVAVVDTGPSLRGGNLTPYL